MKHRVITYLIPWFGAAVAVVSKVHLASTTPPIPRSAIVEIARTELPTLIQAAYGRPPDPTRPWDVATAELSADTLEIDYTWERRDGTASGTSTLSLTP